MTALPFSFQHWAQPVCILPGLISSFNYSRFLNNRIDTRFSGSNQLVPYKHIGVYWMRPGYTYVPYKHVGTCRIKAYDYYDNTIIKKPTITGGSVVPED